MKLVFFGLILTILFNQSGAYADNRRLLLNYVNAPEKEFQILKTTLISDEEGFELYNISFNSLKWMDKTKVENPIWNHNILVIIPDKVESDTCFYRISNGESNEVIPKSIHPSVQHVSLKNNAIGIEIRNIPNQPIKFKDFKQPLKEDGIIAYGWDKFLNMNDVDYVVRLPMLKAAYMGFRVVKDFLKRKQLSVKDYIAFGESKRGWVTWLLPVVDPAVVAIVPSVIDVLNVQKSMKHHKTIYGDWSPVLKDYENFDIPRRMFGKEFANLMEIIDPYKYLTYLKIPKLIINAGNDQFFLPDNSQFYFKDLSVENRMMFLPNSGHRLELNKKQQESLATYFALIDEGKDIPQFFWERKGNTVHIQSSADVKELRVWKATNSKARDFRYWDEKSPQYEEKMIPTKLNQTKFEIIIDNQTDKLFTATFIEALFSLEEGDITFTTEAFIK